MLNKESLGLIKHFFKAYPRRSVMIVGLLLLSGFSEGIGIVTLLPLLEIAVDEAGAGAGDSRILAITRGILGQVGLEPTLAVLLTLIVGGMFLKGLFHWFAFRQVGYTVANVATDLRLMLIRALLRAGWGYFLSQRAGHLSNAIGNEAHRASHAYSNACSLMAGIIHVLVYFTIAVLVSPTVAFAALVAGALIILLFNGMVAMSREAGQRQTVLVKSLSARLIDALHGLKPIKAMAQEQQLQPILEAETRELNEAQRRQVIASSTMSAFQEPLLVTILAIGLFLVLTMTGIRFSGLLVMAFLFHRLVGKINSLQSHYSSIAVSESAFWSLRTSTELAEAQRENIGHGLAAPSLEKSIALRDVWFSYPDTEVLRGVTFDVPAGTFAALVGPSGAGKTTIVDLIIGLYRPQGGEIFVDDIPLGDIDMLAWRREIGYVPQEMLLFHDSIYQNVTLGDAAIERSAAEAALRKAGAWQFVTELPDGLDTVIGERGARLSGGQRQRIAIARALVRQPKLLVLDEVTTALDPTTEAEICRTLGELGGEVTVLAISHQPAIARVADIVYQIKDGLVAPVEPGVNPVTAVGA
jgi:ATP-binding cassette, subfamily C, bacterial